MDANKHKYFMLQILKDVFSDAELVDCLAFRGEAEVEFVGVDEFSVFKDGSNDETGVRPDDTVVCRVGRIGTA